MILGRVFFKVLSSWSFLKSRQLWVWRSHMMGQSPSFLGGSVGLPPGKCLKTERWKTHPGILGLETLTSEGWIKLQLTYNTLFISLSVVVIVSEKKMSKEKNSWPLWAKQLTCFVGHQHLMKALLHKGHWSCSVIGMCIVEKYSYTPILLLSFQGTFILKV